MFSNYFKVDYYRSRHYIKLLKRKLHVCIQKDTSNQNSNSIDLLYSPQSPFKSKKSSKSIYTYTIYKHLKMLSGTLLLWSDTLRRSYYLALVAYTCEGFTAAQRARGTHLVILHTLLTAGKVLFRIEKTLTVIRILIGACSTGDALGGSFAGSAVTVKANGLT